MALKKRKYAVIFDLEFTAWEGSMITRWTRPKELTEVVQIGAVKLDAESLKDVGEFEMLVQPRVNPVLSEYLVELTGITNEMLKESAVDFITAYRAFLDFADGANTYAFGRDDLIFVDNLKYYGWTTLPVLPYANAIPWFRENGVELKGKHACDVAELCGMPFDGHKHTALADAKGVAAGFVALIKRGAPNPFLAPAP